MKTMRFNKAMGEAKRFLQVAMQVKLDKYGQPVQYTKESAACKRASLDLSRALAELRKPD